MNDEQKFTSRRELRDAERAGLVQPEELAFDGAPRVGDVSVPLESTGQPLTRRQLRELEKTGGVLAIHTSRIELPELPTAPERVAEAPAEVGVVAEQALAAATDVVGAEREEPMTIASPIVAPAVATDVVEEPAAEPAALLPPRTPNQSPDAIRKAVADAAEFEAILAGAVQAGATKATGKRRKLIIAAGVLAILVGGLAIAASALGILK